MYAHIFTYPLMVSMGNITITSFWRTNVLFVSYNHPNITKTTWLDAVLPVRQRSFYSVQTKGKLNPGEWASLTVTFTPSKSGASLECLRLVTEPKLAQDTQVTTQASLTDASIQFLSC